MIIRKQLQQTDMTETMTMKNTLTVHIQAWLRILNLFLTRYICVNYLYQFRIINMVCQLIIHMESKYSIQKMKFHVKQYVIMLISRVKSRCKYCAKFGGGQGTRGNTTFMTVDIISQRLTLRIIVSNTSQINGLW